MWEQDIYNERSDHYLLRHRRSCVFAATSPAGFAQSTNQIALCYAVMEPALLRLLGRFGVVFNRIGPDVNYHGMRVPCLASVQKSLPIMKKIAPSLWNLITDQGELLRENR